MRQGSIEIEIEFAYGDASSGFDQILPLQPTPLDIIPERLSLRMRGSNNSLKTIELSNASEYAQHIYKTITVALTADWYTNQTDTSQFLINQVVASFFEWLNTYNITQDNCYKLLKLYESKRTNDDNVKPQSSGVRLLMTILNRGSYAAKFEKKSINYIQGLLKSTTLSISDETIPVTLTAFFSSMPWLRNVIGEEYYLKLGSPKRLIGSFSVTIAVTLLFIIETKKQAQLQLKNSSELHTSCGKTPRVIESGYVTNLIAKLGSLDELGQPSDDLTRLIIADSMPLGEQENLLLIWKSFERGQKFTRPLRDVFTTCHILAEKYWVKPSPLEQILFSWLCAILMVQSNDIVKLRRNNFSIQRNQHGRPVAIQCSYYKGRSARQHTPPMLEASSIEGMAMLAYLDCVDSTSVLVSEAPQVTALGTSSVTITNRLLRLWSDKALDARIRKQLVQRKCSPLFLLAYKSMFATDTESFSVWRSKNTGGIDAYKKNVLRPLPPKLFNLSAIKNSAVHARSDRYREGDLVNQNSHSSVTESIHYLTDANKDWIDQNGRISRLVLNDIEHYAYRPNLDAAIQQIQENVLRTRVFSVLDAGIDSENEVRINSLGQVDFGNDEIEDFNIDADSIIVLDTAETVIIMLHYMNEAKRLKDTLIVNALPFFDRTVLPTVEWMHIIMSTMSSASVQKGDKEYNKIQEWLPPLFTNELNGGVAA